MEKEEHFFKGDYSFLDKVKYQLFKPADSYICCPDLTLNILTSRNNTFIDPIKYLAEYYQNDYYNELLQFTSNLDMTLPLNVNKYTNDGDKVLQIVQHFIESKPEYHLLFASHELNIEYHICHRLKLTKRQLLGIIFQIDIQFNKIEHYDYYNNLYDIYKSDDNIYYFYYVDKKCQSTDHKIRLDHFNNVREVTQIIFNRLSLEALDLCRLDRILTKQFKMTIYNHLIYKRFLYAKVKLVDQIRFMLFSCSILFTIGNTYCQDIDLLIYSKDETAPPSIESVVEKYFIEDRFDLIDLHIRGYFGWKAGGSKEYLNDWFEYEWPALYKAKDMEETVFNPKFHYYFMGLKIISYKADFMRRAKRNRATSYTDLIMLDYFNGIQVEPFELTRKYWKSHQELEYTNNELKELIRKIIKNVVRWHNIKINAKRVYKYIKWPHDFKLTDDDLKEIDNTMDKMVKKTHAKIYNINENLHKIKMVI